MKIYLNIIIASTLLYAKSSSAQEKINLDTIYVRAFDEAIRSKFHSTYKNQYRVGFSFRLDWSLHNIKRDAIFFIYHSPKKEGINEWAIVRDNEKKFLLTKNYFNLKQFAEQLNNGDFFQLIFLKKVQIIMLYGSRCSNEVELYPVELGTDISSEG